MGRPRNLDSDHHRGRGRSADARQRLRHQSARPVREQPERGHSRWREHADELSVSLKLVMLVGEFVSRQYGGRFYGKSQNLIRKMREDYDRVFERYDLLLMPTTPQKATPLPAPGASAEAMFEVALNMNRNTSPFCGGPVTPRSRYPAARATACRSA